jgi:hypothetical protein
MGNILIYFTGASPRSEEPVKELPDSKEKVSDIIIPWDFVILTLC